MRDRIEHLTEYRHVQPAVSTQQALLLPLRSEEVTA
jgi:hypothetical protein